jgi:hypothetical protein
LFPTVGICQYPDVSRSADSALPPLDAIDSKGDV